MLSKEVWHCCGECVGRLVGGDGLVHLSAEVQRELLVVGGKRMERVRLNEATRKQYVVK
jgi:hypothetical protein